MFGASAGGGGGVQLLVGSKVNIVGGLAAADGSFHADGSTGVHV